MASQQELDWWNRFADIMAEQWMLTPTMNGVVRHEYEQDYEAYLHRPGGRLLEVGCGTGWIGRKFAGNGMFVDGVDFSEGQLDIARRAAAAEGLATAAYFRRDLVNDSLAGRFATYDSVLVNAVLHHLSQPEIDSLTARIAAVLEPGGRLYLYEPLRPATESRVRRVLFAPLGFGMLVVLSLIHKVGKGMKLFKRSFLDAIGNGYTGSSPDERSIVAERLRDACIRNGLHIVAERPFHLYGLAVAMSVVRFPSRVAARLLPAVRAAHALDGVLFRRLGWQNLGDDKWVLCGVKIVKAPTQTAAA